MRRRWQAIFSYGEGWSRFRFVVNLNRNTLTFHRSLDLITPPCCGCWQASRRAR
jgi:hypothetical protein